MSIQPITFEIFKNYPLIQAFSTRKGGFSNNYFASLNLGLSTNDIREDVLKNRNSFFSFLGIRNEQLALPVQVHSSNVAIINSPGRVDNCDSIITSKTKIVLTIQTADCFPVFIYDRLKNIIALIHSGWRGTSQNITGKTINLLKKSFDSTAENLLVAIGPGIQQKNYQVDKKTAPFFDKDFLQKDGQNHFRLDIRGAIFKQLKNQSIPLKNIEVAADCTFENEKLYYSYRRDGQNSGRMMGILGII